MIWCSGSGLLECYLPWSVWGERGWTLLSECIASWGSLTSPVSLLTGTQDIQSFLQEPPEPSACSLVTPVVQLLLQGPGSWISFPLPLCPLALQFGMEEGFGPFLTGVLTGLPLGKAHCVGKEVKMFIYFLIS
jgi:hypothetical protein